MPAGTAPPTPPPAMASPPPPFRDPMVITIMNDAPYPRGACYMATQSILTKLAFFDRCVGCLTPWRVCFIVGSGNWEWTSVANSGLGGGATCARHAELCKGFTVTSTCNRLACYCQQRCALSTWGLLVAALAAEGNFHSLTRCKHKPPLCVRAVSPCARHPPLASLFPLTGRTRSPSASWAQRLPTSWSSRSASSTLATPTPSP